jgi:signal transduction histidine kinase
MESESLVGLILLVMFGMLTIVLMLIIFINKAKNKVQNEQLEREKLTSTYRKDLLEHSIFAQEKERDRLSAELHDGIVSKLNIIHFQLSHFSGKLTAEEDESFQTINEILHKTIDETRRISHDLFPVVLENFGIVTALNELKELNRSNQIETLLEVDYKDSDFQLESSIHIYRIIQELVNNSIKYANCTKISIALKKGVDGFNLIYNDNGIGKKTQVLKGKGLGIKNINSRLSILNATLELEQLTPGLKFIITQTLSKTE